MNDTNARSRPSSVDITQSCLRKETVGYGLADSPAGLAAWIYDSTLRSMLRRPSPGSVALAAPTGIRSRNRTALSWAVHRLQEQTCTAKRAIPSAPLSRAPRDRRCRSDDLRCQSLRAQA